MGLDVLFWIAVLTWMAKRSAEDVLHAVKGTPNPRYELKKAKAKAAGQAPPRQPRYASRDWLADLLSDAMVANTEKRRAKAKAKAQPVDDMADVVRDAPRDDRWLTPNPREAEWLTRDSTPCGRCGLGLVGEASNGEPLCTVCGFLSDPRPVFRHETPEPPVPPQREKKPVPNSPPADSPEEREAALRRLQDTASRKLAELDPEMWKRTHVEDRNPRVDYADQRFTCSGCGEERYPAGRKEIPGRGTFCLYCQRDGIADAPTARIYQFPNIKQIEKEIDMSNAEATGLSTAIAFAEAAAQAHASFSTAGSEGYAGALERMGFGDGITALAAEAREQSTVAADRWKALADAMEQFQTGREFYASNPDAPDKVALVNE